MTFPVSVHVPTEKDEDAPPLADGRIAIVCDGVTTASYPIIVNGTERTAGYVASRIVSETAWTFLDGEYERIMKDPFDECTLDDACARMHDLLAGRLAEVADATGATESRARHGLRSRLMPTTLCAVLYRETVDGLQAVCLWTGDSRAYCMDPRGLKQLTEDDQRVPGDALKTLTDDPPLSQVVCADGDFVIHHRSYLLETPSFLFVCSDGVYGYLPSPMHVEDLVSRLGPSISDSITVSLKGLGNDDASLAGAVFGADTDDAFYEAVSRRHDTLCDEYLSRLRAVGELDALQNERTELRHQEMTEDTVSRLNELKDEIRAKRLEKDSALQDAWHWYRKGYETIRSPTVPADPKEYGRRECPAWSDTLGMGRPIAYGWSDDRDSLSVFDPESKTSAIADPYGTRLEAINAFLNATDQRQITFKVSRSERIVRMRTEIQMGVPRLDRAKLLDDSSRLAAVRSACECYRDLHRAGILYNNHTVWGIRIRKSDNSVVLAEPLHAELAPIPGDHKVYCSDTEGMLRLFARTFGGQLGDVLLDIASSQMSDDEIVDTVRRMEETIIQTVYD